MSPVSGRGQRTDAAANRESILAAALAAFEETGDVSLNSIAKRAGVGNATLYRHFPTRESLILAAYRAEVQRVVDSADRLLATKPPSDALRLWVERLAQYAVTKHGLAEALRVATFQDHDQFAETYGLIAGALGRLLSAAADAGVIRPDLDPDDVLLALAGLWQIEPSTRWRARAQALYAVVFSGLRA